MVTSDRTVRHPVARAAEAAGAGEVRSGPLDGVLFDLDGTLVDTMPLHFEAYRRVLRELGHEIQWEDFLASGGGPARDTIPRLTAGLQVAMGPAEIHARKAEQFVALLRRTPPAALATAALLPVLAAHYPMGLVTSGARCSVSAILAVMGWQDRFQVIVSGDDISQGKPDPEGFLAAAAALRARPARCMVFEDTDDGVSAARVAGMRVVDVRRGVPDWRLR